MKITATLFITTVSLLFLSCSSRPTKEQSCWNETNAKKVLDYITAFGSTMEIAKTGKPLSPELIENSCRKRKYQINDRFIILINHDDGSVDGRTFRNSENPATCLNRALNDIKSLQSKTEDNIIALHKEKYKLAWSDPDLSPVGWLNCNEGQGEFDDSVTTFLHELNHQLRDSDKQCIYLASKEKYLCFNLGTELPLRSYGKLEKFPTKNPDAIKGLTAIQKIYLTDVDQPLIMLFDEFNAYSVSNLNYMERLNKQNVNRLFDKDGKRPGIFSPLFYNIMMNYLYRLKKENPKLFEINFIQNTTNKTSLNELLSAVKNIYSTWVEALKKKNKPEKDWERKMFIESQKIEKKLNLIQ